MVAAARTRWPTTVSARTASPMVAPVVTMSSTTTISRPQKQRFTGLEGSVQVTGTLARAQPGLVGRPARHPERLPHDDVGAGGAQQSGGTVGELVDDVGSASHAGCAGSSAPAPAGLDAESSITSATDAASR